MCVLQSDPYPFCVCNQYYSLASLSCYFNQKQALPLLIVWFQDKCFTNVAEHKHALIYVPDWCA